MHEAYQYISDYCHENSLVFKEVNFELKNYLATLKEKILRTTV